MFLKFNLFSIAMAFLILVMTLIPGQAVPDEVDYLFNMDKIVHYSVFSMFALFMIVGFTKQYSFEFLRKQPISYSILFGFSLGVFTESMQLMVPGRSFELADLVVNTLGVFSGWGIFHLIYKL